MTQLPYKVGYGRPPTHSRFQKGQSGNPGGKRRPSRLLKEHFEVALTEALNIDADALRKVRPGKAIESLACKLALQAVDGRPAAQRLVLSLLERDAGDGAAVSAEETRPRPAATPLGAEECRELLGDRYDEFKTRFDKAIVAGSTEDLLALVEDFDGAGEFPASGNS
ncbi:MAG: DUF5681 domain-containing protein [Rhizomicrobium sp.]